MTPNPSEIQRQDEEDHVKLYSTLSEQALKIEWLEQVNRDMAGQFDQMFRRVVDLEGHAATQAGFISQLATGLKELDETCMKLPEGKVIV